MIRTNRYSCMLDAFAEILHVPADSLIHEIGHNGLESDGTPRGFHTQELIECLLRRGKSVTAIELYPVASNEITGTTDPIFFPPTFDRASNASRFARCLAESPGVLQGRNLRGNPHALVWDTFRAYDASGFSYFPILEVLEGTFVLNQDLRFAPHTFLRIS